MNRPWSCGAGARRSDRPRQAEARVARALATSVPAVFALVLVAWPFGAILRRGLVPDGHIDFGPVVDVVASARSRALVSFTVRQALLSTIVTLAIGLPAAWAASRRWWGAPIVRVVSTSAFVMPTVVMGLAFRSVIDRGLRGILLAHAAFNVAVVVRLVGERWRTMHDDATAAARSLGATPGRAFRDVTLPRLRPAVSAAALLTFLFSFTSFGVVLLLGDSGQATIETEIYRLTRTLRFDAAAALALVQVVVVAAVFAANGAVARRTTVLQPRAPAELWPLAGVVASAPALALVTVPVAVLAARVLHPGGRWGLAGLRTLARDDLVLPVRPIETLGISLRYAAVACGVAMLVGMLAAATVGTGRRRFGRVVDVLLLLPLGVSAVTIGYGYLITFDEAPLRLRDHWYAVPLAHAAVAVPFVVRALVPALGAVDPRVREAAASLGARRMRVWTSIDLPLVAPALAVAAGFAAAISLGEFGATALLGRNGTPTAPFAITRLLGAPGSANRLAADALALVLVGLTLVVMAIAERVGARSGRRVAARDIRVAARLRRQVAAR